MLINKSVYKEWAILKVECFYEKVVNFMHKEHIKELDVLRAIGFIFVVAQHIFGAYAWWEGAGFAESLILSLYYLIAQPAVPTRSWDLKVSFMVYVNGFKDLSFLPLNILGVQSNTEND